VLANGDEGADPTSVRLNKVEALALDDQNQYLFVAESYTSVSPEPLKSGIPAGRVRVVRLGSPRAIYTLWSGPKVRSLAADRVGHVYIGAEDGSIIRLRVADRSVTSIGAIVGLRSTAVDSGGTVLYGVSPNDPTVTRVSLPDGATRIVAGTDGSAGFSGDKGPPTAAQLSQPTELALDPSGKHLYINDRGNRRVRMVDLDSFLIDTVVGVGASGAAKDVALSTGITGLAVDGRNRLFILDNDRCNVLRVETPAAIPARAVDVTVPPGAIKVEPPSGTGGASPETSGKTALETVGNQPTQVLSPAQANSAGAATPAAGNANPPPGASLSVQPPSPPPGQTAAVSNTPPIELPPSAAPAPGPLSGVAVPPAPQVGGNAGLAPGQGDPAKGAIRYAMVRSSEGPGALAGLAVAAAAGLVTMFACIVLAAPHASTPKIRARPSRAY
jgi:hypothetical protein